MGDGLPMLYPPSPTPSNFATFAFLLDETSGTLQAHDPGERIEADPAMNRLTVAGKPPAKKPELSRAGRYELFFKAAGHINERYRSPDVALAALSGWAIVLALSGTYGQLLNYSTVGDWLGYAAAVATLFYYRRARSDETIVFRMKGYPILPLIFIVAVLCVVASNIISNPTDAGMGLVIALLGLPVYWFWSRSRRAAARG